MPPPTVTWALVAARGVSKAGPQGGQGGLGRRCRAPGAGAAWVMRAVTILSGGLGCGGVWRCCGGGMRVLVRGDGAPPHGGVPLRWAVTEEGGGCDGGGRGGGGGLRRGWRGCYFMGMGRGTRAGRGAACARERARGTAAPRRATPPARAAAAACVRRRCCAGAGARATGVWGVGQRGAGGSGGEGLFGGGQDQRVAAGGVCP